MSPDFSHCLITDLIREELYGKLTLLGFLGVCPHVDVGLRNVEQPTALTFLIVGEPFEGSFMSWFEVFDEAEQRVIASTAPVPVAGNPRIGTTVAATLVLVFGHSGPFTVRLFADGMMKFRAPFRVSHGSPSA